MFEQNEPRFRVARIRPKALSELRGSLRSEGRDKMNDQPKGHCKHGEFILTEGCPECIAEQRASAQEAPPASIVKVKYYSESTGKYSDREYAYFSVDRLGVGQLVQAPVGDNRVVKAVVTATDVPEAEIEAFRERVKTIPSVSIRPGPAAVDKALEEPEPAQVTLFDQKPEPEPPQEEFKGVPFGEGVVATSTEEPERPPALAVIETQVGRPTTELFQLYKEAAGLLRFAKKRVIATNEDLKPATDDLAIIAKCKKGMFERKNEIVGPFKARLDAINQAFADLMFPVLEADRLTRLQVTEYDNKVRAQVAEAKRIEDEKFRLAQEETALTGEHTVELGTAVAPTPVPEHTRTDLGTLGGRTNWKARVVDFGLLPDEYKLPNEPLLNSFARSTKGTRPIPGVEFYDDRVVTMRTK
ncbi:hypothetical protein ES703_25811 [subsurface metagenome]